MNFLELINKCLLELNYRPVNSFSELVKNDHKRIKTILNIVNKEICALEGWNFLLRKKQISIPANTGEISNTVNGRILFFIIDGEKYDFEQNVEPFISSKVDGNKYSFMNDKILIPKFSESKNADVFYYTNNCVVDSNNEEQQDFVNSSDVSLIPMPFAQQLLVYGTCLRLKANPSYIRFNYWMSMYKEALLNLKSKSCKSFKNFSTVRLFRN